MKVQELRTATGKTYLSIYYDEQDNWVRNDWSGYVTPENVAQGSLAVLHVLERYRVSCGLNDNRHLVGRWDQSVDWIEKEWMPRAAATGLRYYAHVVDDGSLAAPSSSEMQHRSKEHFQMRIFQDIASAKEWLRKCQENDATNHS